MESSAFALPNPALLDDLSDVPGVIAWMVISIDGELLAARLPAELEARSQAAAPRLAILLDALSAGRSISNYCLRYFEHRLHVLQIGEAYLCVLSELWSPSPVLKMALNVTGKRMQ